MNNLEAIHNHISVPFFNGQSLVPNQLPILIQAANAAPISNGLIGKSKRHITIIQNREYLNRVSRAMADMEIDIAGQKFERPLYGATALFIISANKNIFGTEVMNAAVAAQNISLAATDLGLNSVIMVSPVFALRDDKDLLERIEIPECFYPYVAVAIGYADLAEIKPAIRNAGNVNYI